MPWPVVAALVAKIVASKGAAALAAKGAAAKMGAGAAAAKGGAAAAGGGAGAAGSAAGTAKAAKAAGDMAGGASKITSADRWRTFANLAPNDQQGKSEPAAAAPPGPSGGEAAGLPSAPGTSDRWADDQQARRYAVLRTFADLDNERFEPEGQE